METITKKLYEGMFLLDSALAVADWKGALKSITDLLEKSDAEVESVKKWDERTLAYEIQGKSRGTYILVYFRAEGPRIQEIERNVKLSEKIMRVLILSTESMSEEDLQKDTPAEVVEKRAQQREKAAEAEAAEKAEAESGVKQEQSEDDQVEEAAEEGTKDGEQDKAGETETASPDEEKTE